MGPFISDMQLKVFVTKVVEPNVFVLNVNLHRIHVFGLGLELDEDFRSAIDSTAWNRYQNFRSAIDSNAWNRYQN